MRPATLALDIGGTKIAYGLVPDDSPHEVIGAGRLPSLALERRTLEQVRAAVATALSTAGDLQVVRCGVGAPGVVRGGVIASAGDTMPGWAGTEVAGTVAELTGRHVSCDNDVRVWAFGEHHLGAGEGSQGRVLYLSLGTGVGGAIVDKQQLLDGPTGTAGEAAHLVCADVEGRAVGCEASASGTGLTTYYNARSARPPVDLPEIISRMRDGERLAGEIVRGNLRGFGRAVGALATLLDLSAIVLGGGVGSLGEIVRDPFADGVRETILPLKADLPVRTTSLGPAAPLVAAAAYARSQE
ncbi:ROK family protein [Corynebacterium sp.]|uniref:ROK family protein n=1 Tax=Corynebacterium sp. TaxID=1720 RepID=UPI0026DF9E74|nr:ROK family protein [Corynebacterium sp.]MDO5512489.1 ROK family protein [Corynebacterium sp.]